MKKAINQNFRLSTTYKILCLYFICSADIKAQYSPNDSVTSKNLNELLLIAKPKKEFFCRIEEKLIKKSKINFCFRLGSKEYTNYIEYSPYLTKK